MHRVVVAAATLAFLTSASLAETKPRVIDGDTIEHDGKRIRMRNHNAPETYASKGKHAPKCPAEAALGERSKARLKEMVDKGKVVEYGPVKAIDKYRREVREVKIDGVDPGKVLRAEGLAKRSGGNFCN